VYFGKNLEDNANRWVSEASIPVEEILSQFCLHADQCLYFVFGQALQQLSVFCGELMAGSDQSSLLQPLQIVGI
jgi:hypothetical protein